MVEFTTNPPVVVVTKADRPAAAALFGVKVTRGAEAYAAPNVTSARSPAAEPVPVVNVIVPLTSLPATVQVAPDPACAPAAAVGVVPASVVK